MGSSSHRQAVVAGGAGFIGSHLCDLLIRKGLQVICVDNLITGSRQNIAGLFGRPGFRFLNLDISRDIIPESSVDYIFHFASPASPLDYQNYPEETALANSLGTLRLLQLARATGARFLLASTSEAYGDPLQSPQAETYWGNVNSFGPRSCYDESKRFAETLSYIYLHKYDLDIRIIRIFNTYGPRMRASDGRVVSNFINQALTGAPLTVYGRGSQTRSLCYISDLVAGVDRAMFTPGLRGEIFNLGNPEETAVLDLAKKIKGLTGSESPLVFKPPLPDDPHQRRPDISKARRLLHWQPQIPAAVGLPRTIAHYRNLAKSR